MERRNMKWLDQPWRGKVDFDGIRESFSFLDQWGRVVMTFDRTSLWAPRRGEAGQAIASFRQRKRNWSLHLYLLPGRRFFVDHVDEWNPDFGGDAPREHAKEIIRDFQQTPAGQVFTGIAIGSAILGGIYFGGKLLSTIFGRGKGAA